jgi:hypothetical protein
VETPCLSSKPSVGVDETLATTPNLAIAYKLALSRPRHQTHTPGKPISWLGPEFGGVVQCSVAWSSVPWRGPVFRGVVQCSVAWSSVPWPGPEFGGVVQSWVALPAVDLLRLPGVKRASVNRSARQEHKIRQELDTMVGGGWRSLPAATSKPVAGRHCLTCTAP